ncbi:MAG: DUF962 domain-containing protein [Burkholderiales bacterium]|nr:DUF962 domain-containing protein [Burkholderiales bacterium]
MPSLTDQVANYAAYHRDRRNIATHFVGVPMIVFAVAILLSRPGFELAGLPLTPAWLLVAATCAFYVSMSVGYGLVMTVLLALITWAAGFVAAGGTALWLGAGFGLFVIGWAIQFLGHYYEGRKPAFVDDLVGLLIGPLFLVVETAYALGLSGALRRAVEARVGPTHDGSGRKAPGLTA